MKTLTINAIVITGIAMLAGLAAYNSQAEVPAPKLVSEKVLVSPGKATAPVTMTHNLSATPAVGQPLKLELVFATGGHDTVELQINIDKALAVGPRLSRHVKHGDSVVVDLVPQAEGRFYVDVIAQVKTGAKVFSIPVQVGKGSYRSTAQKATTSPNGERLIRMQAQEPIG